MLEIAGEGAVTLQEFEPPDERSSGGFLFICYDKLKSGLLRLGLCFEMNISLDSNAWERLFDCSNEQFAQLRNLIKESRLRCFVCEAGIKIESIRKSERSEYFQSPKVSFEGCFELKDGKTFLKFSFGPDDTAHPGIPIVMRDKFEAAITHGVKIMRAGAWLGLPSPKEIRDNSLYCEDHDGREQMHWKIFAEIEQRGVGKHKFDELGGWSGQEAHSRSKKFAKACAEWADAELVAAHIAYGHKFLCTDDFGQSAGSSVFDVSNRKWLIDSYNVEFLTLDRLNAMVVENRSLHFDAPI